MIRTHRPRGYLWNCPSLFQDTPLFRAIDVDDCEVAPDTDSDDEFAPSERAAKRRRIGKLADDFLNGRLPSIPSLTLLPSQVPRAVSRSFALAKDARDALAEFQPEEGPHPMWEDVLDDHEVLNALLGLHDTSVGVDTERFDAEPVVVRVEAQASCGPKRRLRSTKVTFGPSDEALRKAAELRSRRNKASALVLEDLQLQSCPKPFIPETQTHPSYLESQETESDCGPSPTPAWTSSKWIRSGAFELRKKAADEECSRDELGASSFNFTPSQRTRSRARPLARAHSTARTTSNPSFESAPSASSTTAATTSFPLQGYDNLENAATDTILPSEASVQASMSESNYDLPESHDAEEDSQTRLFRRQGVRRNARQSWSTIDEVTEPSEAPVDTVGQHHIDGPSNLEARTGDSMETAEHAAIARVKSRRAKSAANSPAAAKKEALNRRRSTHSESQNAANQFAQLPKDQQKRMGSFRTQYTAVAASDGGSPFVFRKRLSKFNDGENPDIEPIVVDPKPQQRSRPRKKAMPPSLDEPQPTEKALEPNASVVGSTSLEIDPQTPLVNEHLNSVLPRDATSGRRSSSLRRALRAEMRASGADITGYSDDHATVVQLPHPTPTQPHVDENDENMPAQVADVESQPPPMWCTQQLLEQARHDLFTSPDKTNSALYLSDKTTPQACNNTTTRKPLRTMSQEPMASTQALLDDWRGFSSVKKRVSGDRRPTIDESPTLEKGMSTASDPVESLNRRRSTLRFSISMDDIDSPNRLNTITSQPLASTTPESLPANRNESPRSASNRMNSFPASSHAFGSTTMEFPSRCSESQQDPFVAMDDTLKFGASVSSLQNAQCPMMLQDMDMDSQELNLTVMELTEDVLGSATVGMESSGF